MDKPIGVAFLTLFVLPKSTLCEELLPWLNRMKTFTEVSISQMYNYDQFVFHVQDKCRDNTLLFSWQKQADQSYVLKMIEKSQVQNRDEAFAGVAEEDEVIFSFSILLPYFLESKTDILTWVDSLEKLCRPNSMIDEKTRELVDMLRSNKAKKLCSGHNQEECYECVDRDSRCYNFNSYYDESRDWMACEITRAYEPVPFTTIIKRFRHEGYEPMFAYFFMSSEFGTDEDLRFLSALWDSMYPKTKFDLPAIREKYTKRCYPSEDNMLVEEEPMIFRKPLEAIVKIGKLNTNEIY